MRANMEKYVNDSHKHSVITDKIIKAYYNVYNTLGYGFLEKVYEKSMLIELKNLGLNAHSQYQIKVKYKGKEVGEYYADIIVEDCVILELKASKTIVREYEAQLLNYLKATKYEVGLLLNFGNEPQIKRRVFNNEFKDRIKH
jgi:GxxExxY protein